VNAITTHLARRVGLTLEVLRVPTLPRLGVRLAIIARVAPPVVVAVTTPPARAHMRRLGWASLAGFWKLSKILHAKPEILSIFVLIKYPLKFLQISKNYINLYKIQKNTKYFFINPLE
jgi:hypothetical protein